MKTKQKEEMMRLSGAKRMKDDSNFEKQKKEMMRLAGVKYVYSEKPGFFEKTKIFFDEKKKQFKNFLVNFIDTAKERFDGFIIEHFNLKRADIVRVEFLSTRYNNESLKQFLKRKGYNSIFYKLINIKREETTFNKYLKKQSGKSIDKKQPPSYTFDFRNDFIERLQKQKQKAVHPYNGLSKESEEWIKKIRVWDSVALVKRSQEKKGLSYVDFMMHNDRMNGKIFVGS
jgi:hypothetical protein